MAPDDRGSVIGRLPGEGFPAAEPAGGEHSAGADQELPPTEDRMTRRGEERASALRTHSAGTFFPGGRPFVR
jgi:hypothetical protein